MKKATTTTKPTTRKRKPAAEDAKTATPITSIKSRIAPEEVPLATNGRLNIDPEIEARARQATATVEVVADDWQKKIEQRIADAESETPEFQADPLQETVRELQPLLPNQGKGMSFKLCSPRINARRGRRNWEPLIHPETNQPVTLQGMTLCWMPKVSAKRRNHHYQEIGNEQVREAQKSFKAKAGDITREAERQGVRGLGVLDENDTLVSNDPRKGREDYLGREEHIGFGTTRGDLRIDPEANNLESMIQEEVSRRLEAMDLQG